jgi:hypothetical protein
MGGKSTGPKTSGGKVSNKMKNWKHGVFSIENRLENKTFQSQIKKYKQKLKNL